MNYIKYIFVFAIWIALVSCYDQGDCQDASTTTFIVKFLNNSDKKTLSLTLDSVTVAGFDTILYKSKKVSGVDLPLHPERESMTYNIYYEGKTSVLSVTYKTKSFALSPTCNAIDLYTITNAEGDLIANVVLSIPDVTRTNTKANVNLYF